MTTHRHGRARAAVPAAGVSGNAGFSVPEVLAAVVLAGLLTALGVLNAAALRSRFQLRAAVRQLASDLQLARARAIAENTGVRITFTGGTYHAERAQGGSWQPLALHAHRTASLAAEVIPLPEGVSLAPSPDGFVVFEPGGSADAAQTITVAHVGIGTSRTLSVTRAGRTQAS